MTFFLKIIKQRYLLIVLNKLFMRRIIFLVVLLLSFLFSYGQSNNTVTQIDWAIENPNQWGSFYWAVTREPQPNLEGRYFYYVYFYSNSLFNTKSDGVNYDRASTYIRGINIQMEERIKNPHGNDYITYNVYNLQIPYFTCDYYFDKYNYVAYFYSASPFNNFKVTFDKASAFDYSIYKR